MDKTIAHTKASLYDIFYATKAKRTYTNLGISLLLIIFFLVFALIPTITTIGTIQEKIIAYKNLNSLLKAKIESAKKLDKQLNTTSSESPDGLKEQIDFMNKVYMKDYDLETIYINLYERAKSANVKILAITPKYLQNDVSAASVDDFELAPTSHGYELVLSMISNDMRSINNFLKSIEGYQEMPIICRVKSLVINDTEAASNLNMEGDRVKENPETYKRGINFTVNLIVYIDQTRYAP